MNRKQAFFPTVRCYTTTSIKEMGKARKLLVQEPKPRPLEYETEILTTLFQWLVSLHLKITVVISPCQMFIYT
jgi:hypothetical protein